MHTGKVIALSFFVSLATSAGAFFFFHRLAADFDASAAKEPLPEPGVEVPLLTGMRPDQARQLLRSSGLLLIVTERAESSAVNPGLIMSQAPLEGSNLKPGSEVEVIVSEGLSQVEVPEVVGLGLDEAIEKLEKAELKAVKDGTKESEEVAEGQLISQDPEAGDKVDPGTEVKLVVSAGAPGIEVPRLYRMKIDRAKREIKRTGFAVGKVEFKDHPENPGGTVLRQDPKSGTLADKGSPINIWVNTFE